MFKLFLKCFILTLLVFFAIVATVSAVYNHNTHRSAKIFNLCDGEFIVTTNRDGRDMRYINWEVQCVKKDGKLSRTHRGTYDAVLGH